MTAKDDFTRHYHSRRKSLRRVRVLYAIVALILVAASMKASEVSFAQLGRGLPQAWRYVEGTIPHLRLETFLTDVANWYWGYESWLRLLAETVLMAFVGTVIGAALALLLCFPASSNLVSSRTVTFGITRLLEAARTVPDLVWALIFVYAYGVGPLAGVLALAIHTMGTLGKQFSEVNENVDLRPVESLQASGATWAMSMRLAVLPQVLPNFLSYGLLRFEINVRSASVFGVVGAGGIGEELYLSVRQFDYPDISAILIMIALLVALLDMTCEAIRHRQIGREALGAV